MKRLRNRIISGLLAMVMLVGIIIVPEIGRESGLVVEVGAIMRTYRWDRPNDRLIRSDGTYCCTLTVRRVRCCGGSSCPIQFQFNSRLVDIICDLRREFNQPITSPPLNGYAGSAFRCNNSGNHGRGMAIDVTFGSGNSRIPVSQVIQAARRHGANGDTGYHGNHSSPWTHIAMTTIGGGTPPLSIRCFCTNPGRPNVTSARSTMLSQSGGVRTGNGVVWLQNALNLLGFRDNDSRTLETDGIFGPRTEAAVRAFQRAEGITVDGIVGPVTMGRLDTRLRSRCPTPIRTVTFNAHNGNATSSRTIANNTRVGTLPTPTRAGHTFNGWFTSATGGTRITADRIITGNVTFRAQWTRNEPPVTTTPPVATAPPVTTSPATTAPTGTSPQPTETTPPINTPQQRIGDVTDTGEIIIADALAILRYLVGLPSPIADCNNARIASLITDPTANSPTIADALAILRHLVGLPSELD